MVAYFMTCCCLCCCPTILKRVPHNFFILAIFTLSLSYMVSATTAYYNPKIVLEAGILTAGITVALTLYAL
jgi:FtsH-binding integral membrane protein